MHITLLLGSIHHDFFANDGDRIPLNRCTGVQVHPFLSGPLCWSTSFWIMATPGFPLKIENFSLLRSYLFSFPRQSSPVVVAVHLFGSLPSVNSRSSLLRRFFAYPIFIILGFRQPSARSSLLPCSITPAFLGAKVARKVFCNVWSATFAYGTVCARLLWGKESFVHGPGAMRRQARLFVFCRAPARSKHTMHTTP